MKASRLLFTQLIANRKQVLALFYSNWRNATRSTGLGLIWNYLLPLVPLGIYCLLAEVRVLPAFPGVDPVAYIAFGVTIWFLLAGTIQVPISTVDQKKFESAQTSFPLICTIAANYAQLLFDTMVRLVLTAALVILAETQLSWGTLTSFLVLLPALPLFFSIGLFLSIVNLVYKDVARITAIALQYGIFISGVIFPVSHIGFLTTFNTFNPLAIYVDAVRMNFFLGITPSSGPYLTCSIVAFFTLVLSARVFFVMEERIRDA